MKSSGNPFVNTALVVLVIGSMIFSLAVADSPAPPHNFLGTMTVDGSPAPVGSQIKAMVGSQDVTGNRTDPVTFLTESLGSYGIGIDPNLEADCENGEIVTFKVKVPSGGFRDANEQYECLRGQVTNLPLTVGNGGPECTEGDTRSCPNQQGVCDGSFETCTSGGYWPGCDYSSLPDYEETEASCDGLDNDCDGVVDGMARDCSVDHLGICAVGTETCTAGIWGGCPESQTETCNGLDDDCDGDLDGSEGLFQECGTSDVGACQYGTQQCQDDGSWGACDGNIDPVPEVCTNEADDDCDGFTDCLDGDCSEHPSCVVPEYCLEITGLAVLDVNFAPAASIMPGTMYNIEMTTENSCQGDVESMQVVQVSTGGTPVNLGTVRSTILAEDTSVITVGFVLPSDTVSGTGFTADAYNWNHWITQDPGTWEALSEPASAGFQAA
jgi:hypothetical protein